MAMMGALKQAVLGHIRIPVTQTSLSICGSNKVQTFPYLVNRVFSSHVDHPTKDQVTERVLSVIKDFTKVGKSDPSKVTSDVHFQKDLSFDSWDFGGLIMALEEEFKLEIPDTETDKLGSTKLAIEYIYNHPMAN